MTIKFNITTNAIDAKHWADGIARKQLPFGISRAINRLAYDVREQEQGALGKYFNLRTNWLTKKGAMPVVPSKKNQYPNIYAILGVKDEVAALAITGGRKEGKGMATPFSNAGTGASTRSILNPGIETLTRKTWPTRIVKEKKKRTKRRVASAKPKPFYIKGKSGRTFVALRSGVSRYPLQILYGFKDSVEVPKSWPLVENTQGFVANKYGPYLQQEIDKAIASMKF